VLVGLGPFSIRRANEELRMCGQDALVHEEVLLVAFFSDTDLNDRSAEPVDFSAVLSSINTFASNW
jgi:hypothetical protein